MSKLMSYGWIVLGLFLGLPACGSGQNDADGGVDAGLDAYDGSADAGGDGAHFMDECIAGVEPDANWGFMVIQDFSSQDDSIHIRMVLNPGEGSTVGETIPYHLVRFALVSDTQSLCVDQTSQLDYQWGHHNWDETGRARHDDTEYIFRMLLEIVGTGGWTDSLEARSLSSGDVLWGPLTLVDTGCRTQPPGNPNACLFRD